MPKAKPVLDGVAFQIRRSGGDSEVLSDKAELLYLLRRPWEGRFDRQWQYNLYAGQTLFHADTLEVQPLLTLVRLQQEYLIRLQAPDQRIFTDVIRIDTSAGYVGSDPRHRFQWQGNTYLLTARTHSTLFGGRDVECINEQTNETVMQFTEKNFSSKQTGTVTISRKFSGTALVVMVGAFFAFREFDQRRKLLMWGDPVFTANVTG